MMLLLGFGLVGTGVYGRQETKLNLVYVEEANELNVARRKVLKFIRYSRRNNFLTIDWSYALNGRETGWYIKDGYNMT